MRTMLFGSVLMLALTPTTGHAQRPDGWKVRVNFPYPASTRPYREVPLLPASWRNSCQYIGSRRAAFRSDSCFIARIALIRQFFLSTYVLQSE